MRMTMFTKNDSAAVALLLAAGLLLISMPMHADDVPAHANKKHWDIGINTRFSTSPFVDGKDSISAMPTRLSHDALRLPGLSIAVSKKRPWQPYLGVGFGPMSHNRDDSAALADMKSLKRAIHLRVGVAVPLNRAQFSAELGQDVAGAHKGLLAKARYTKSLQQGNKELRPYVEAQWLSADVTDYYVGVDGDEITAQRAAYSADADTALQAGVGYRQRLSAKWTLLAGAHITQYGSEISDSPIVEDSTVWGARVGMAYRWK